jgi:hypothetical protein
VSNGTRITVDAGNFRIMADNGRLVGVYEMQKDKFGNKHWQPVSNDRFMQWGTVAFAHLVAKLQAKEIPSAQ